MTKLLNIDANAKTVKGQKRGYMTAVLYLAPFKASGYNVCPMAEIAGCHAGCLNTAGRGGIAKDRKTFATPAGQLPDNNIQRARIARTRLYVNARDEFMRQLVHEIQRFVIKAERKGLTPCVRLNGTSDIQWEKVRFTFDASKNLPAVADVTIFDVFPDIQFYDYTKIVKRMSQPLPANYHLSLSYSEASPKYADSCMRAHQERGAALVVVYHTAAAKRAAFDRREFGLNVDYVDGDEYDMRFLDPCGAVVLLKAKGAARKDTSGFVLRS